MVEWDGATCSLTCHAWDRSFSYPTRRAKQRLTSTGFPEPVESFRLLVTRGWPCFCLLKALNRSYRSLYFIFLVGSIFECEEVRLWVRSHEESIYFCTIFHFLPLIDHGAKAALTLGPGGAFSVFGIFLMSWQMSADRILYNNAKTPCETLACHRQTRQSVNLS